MRQRLSAELGAAEADTLLIRLVEATGLPDVDARVLVLLDELEELSEKAVRAAIEALPDLDRRAALSQILLWLDLGVALAESSGACALKYFKDSPLILSVIEPEKVRTDVLTIGLDIAEQDANAALEYVRYAPQIVSEVPLQQLRPWLDVSLELAQTNVVVGLEFIRQIPTLIRVLPLDHVRDWATLGMKFIVPNSLGKPDYVATMEFLRTSPAILGNIEAVEVRAKVVSLCLQLAEQSPEAGLTWLTESPEVLRTLPSMEWQLRVLGYGALLAEKHAGVTLEYLRRAPDLVSLIGPGPECLPKFEKWFGAGMDVLAYSPEGAQAYFAAESQKALTSVEEALSGVPFRQVARRLKLFVQGLCGTDVTVAALPDSLTSPTRATVSQDGRCISLPALLRRYPTAEENERLYLAMATHEAGHLEFGTYRLGLESLTDLIEMVQRRYGRSPQEKPATLAALFELYPNPTLVRDLWVVLEDARVEFLLHSEYPGLRSDLARLAAESISPRDPAQGVTPMELIVDGLLRLSTGEAIDAAVPKAVRQEVTILWGMSQAVLQGTATAERTVRVVDEVYVKLDELLRPHGEMLRVEKEEQPTEQDGAESQPVQSGEDYRATTQVVYRGSMNPELIAWSQESLEQNDQQPDLPNSMETRGNRKETHAPNEREVGSEGRAFLSAVEESLTVEADRQSISRSTDEGLAFLYPEWDHRIDDYRMNWCAVVEQPADLGSDEFVTETLASQRSAIQSLRRFFEGLRPPAFRRVTGQPDGEEVDLDAVVRRSGEQRAGMEGSDRVYVRREKRERNVAVAFLVDVSGSTSREIGEGRRVIDIEKAGLVLLCEALDAVGDQYGLYAYSSRGRTQVDFLTIKDFDERLSPSTAHRLGGLAPRHQNRDGAAIRHATTKLLTREVRHRLLILLSDGRPLDDQYKDDYALEDTKTALREARQRGVETFCVTVDREAEQYLNRMYAHSQYCVVDRVEALPTTLPRIYRQLTA